MRIIRRRGDVAAPADRIFSVLEDPRMADDLNPAFLRTEVIESAWIPSVGARTSVKLTHRGASYELVTELKEYRRGAFLLERQVEGPFASFEHAVNVEAQADGTTITEILAYAPGYGLLGRLLDALALRRDLEETLAMRQARLRDLLQTLG